MRKDRYDFLKENIHLLDIDLENGLIKNRKSHDNKHGYLSISLKCKKYLVHQIIAYLKYGEDVIGKEVNHIDINKCNNKPNNIELTDRSGNIKHAHQMGCYTHDMPKGEKHFNSRFNEDEIIKIKQLLKTGVSTWEIGKMYKVSYKHIWAIKMGKLWSHVTI